VARQQYAMTQRVGHWNQHRTFDIALEIAQTMREP
jgi:hypothetical protein